MKEKDGECVWWRKNPKSLPYSCCGWHAPTKSVHTRPHPRTFFHTQSLCHTHMATHAKAPTSLRMHAWLCSHIHSHCTKPIIQSESMHKFSSVVAACPVKVRALFLSEPAVWQIPASSIYICAQSAPSSSSSGSFFIFLLFVFSLLACGFHSFLPLSFHSFISPFHPLPSL